MTAERLLIVNADDFGQSPGITGGVIEAVERGIVTSASLMVRWPAAAAAAAFARARPGFSLGLHLDLGEWRYRDGAWSPIYRVVPAEDAAAVAAEVARQWDRFIALAGRPPTHLDSHQHVHRDEPLRSILRALADRHRVPLRHCSPRVRYSGAFYGQTARGEPLPRAISTRALLALLAALPPGVTELGCHPGLDDDLDSMYRAERPSELRALCDPRVRAAIARLGIRLRSFATLDAEPPPASG